MKGSITYFLLRDAKKIVKKALKIFVPGIILGILIAVLCLSQARAQNYQTDELTLIDSLDVSGGTISSADAEWAVNEIFSTADLIIDLKILQKGVEKTLDDLFLYQSTSDELILPLEAKYFDLETQIEENKLLIIKTCKKMNFLTVLEGHGRRNPKHRFMGIYIMKKIKKYCKDNGVSWN